jgi:hypothetical protein
LLVASSREEGSKAIALLWQTPLPVDPFLAAHFHILALAFSPEASGVLAQRSQRNQLLGSQHASNPYFTQHSHAHRGRLGGCDITQTLFDHTFVRIIGVQCFFESPVRFA